MNLRKKIVISILIVGFISLVAGLYVTNYQVRNLFKEAIGRDFARIAEKTAEKVDEKIQDEIITFQYLASNKDVIRGLKENRVKPIDVYLKFYLGFVKNRNENLGLFVVNAKGRIIIHSNLKPEYSLDQSEELWWKVTYGDGNGKVYVSDIYIDELTGNMAFDIGIPVLDPETDRVIGGIRKIIDINIFFDFIKEINFGKTGHVMLTDSNGVPLVCPLHPLGEHYMNIPLINLIKSRESGWAIAEDDGHGGKNAIVGFSPVKYMNAIGVESPAGNKWYTFLRQDPKETFAPVNRVILNVFLLESALILLLGLTGLFIVRKLLLQPMNVIHSGVDRIGKGNLDYKIDINTGDEFETLAGGFNRMSSALKESYEALEDKIKERTIELEKTKNYLESILKYSGDMIITTDTDARIVTFNEGAERVLGYKKKEMIGTSMTDFYHNKEDREKLLKIIESGVMVTNYETKLVRKDGRIIDISLSLSLLRDENGKVIGTVGISKDITEWNLARKQLEEYSQKLEGMVNKRTLELEESKSHLEAMLGGIASGIVFTNQDNKITFLNHAAEEIFDIKREDWLGMDFKDAHSPEAHKKALQLIEDMKDGKVKSYSSEINISEKTIFAKFSPIMHGQEYLGVIFIATDITEIKRLQKEVEASEERYKDLVENSPEMIHSVNDERYFIDVNKTGLDTLGYTIEEMRSKQIEDIVPEEFKEKVKKHIGRVITEGRSRVEVQFITRDDKRRDVEISATALYNPITSEFVRTRAFVRDITEIRRLQAELVQTEKLALVGKMSAAIAHELRNPLVPIGGFANLIYKRLADESPLKKYSDIIVKEISRLEKLLHNILYFTKEIKPELQPANLNEIITELLFLYNDTFEDNHIKTFIRLSSDIQVMQLDSSQIKQALINIFSNAIHAMQGGGKLTVECKKIEREGKLFTAVRIGDTGSGIPEDVRASIFEPFYTTKIQGLGLGLTLTKGIVEAHGGYIEVESTEGRGSSFLIFLPVVSDTGTIGTLNLR